MVISHTNTNAPYLAVGLKSEPRCPTVCNSRQLTSRMRTGFWLELECVSGYSEATASGGLGEMMNLAAMGKGKVGKVVLSPSLVSEKVPVSYYLSYLFKFC